MSISLEVPDIFHKTKLLIFSVNFMGSITSKPGLVMFFVYVGIQNNINVISNFFGTSEEN